MLLIELTSVPDAALPVAAFRDHLRLGSGFADEGAEDAFLQALLRAALAAVEARTGKALFSRDFALTLRSWRNPVQQALPVAPVSAVTRLVSIDAIDTETEVDAGAWRLVADSLTPVLTGTGACLPAIPNDGAIRIEFTAGYGADWSDLPADVAQAVLMLAATYYEFRHEARLSSEIMPHGVAALLEPHRTVRIGLGGAAQ